MQNSTVWLGRLSLKGFVGLVLGALLATGCRSSHESGYADIPELPGTPLGIPASQTSAPLSASTDLTAVSAASGGSEAISSGSVPATPVAASGSAPESTRVTQKHAAPAESKSTEIIRVGEILHITFSDTVQALPAVDDKVKDDGTITLMYNESFHAADLTESDLAKEIRRRYVPDYYQQLTATVTRDVMRSFYVDGEVRAPSKQVYTGPITVTQAIASAGGFTDFANKKKVRLIRANGKIEVINCKKLIEHPELDPEVYPGDKVHVPRSLI